MKRFLSTLCALCAATLAWADTWTDPETGYTWTYSRSGSNATITNVSPNTGTNLTFPDKVGDNGEYTVTGINGSDYGSLSRYKNFAGSLTLPEGLTTIGEDAFSGCTGFTGSLTLPEGLTTIASYAFFYCSGFTEIHISDLKAWCAIDFEDVYSNPLCYAKNLYLNGELVTDLVIPEGVTSIADYLFYNCTSLTSVTIPDSVTEIGQCAFKGCTSLTSAKLPANLESIKLDLFWGCTNLESVVIPDSVTFIGSYAFAYCPKLTEIRLPQNLSTLQFGAFRECTGLASIEFPSGITVIEYDTFRYCTGLTSLSLPESLVTIGDYAFSGCYNLSGPLILPKSLTSIGDLAFNGCAKFSGVLTLPDGLETIGGLAFFGCSGFTGSLRIPDSVTSMGRNAFHGCSGFNGTLTLSRNLTRIESETFSGCIGFTGQLVIPSGVTFIGYDAFRSCRNFTGALVLPEGLTTIDSDAFYGCTGLTSVTLPKSLTSIGSRAFSSTGITDVFAKCAPTHGFADSRLLGARISYPAEYGAAWNQVLKDYPATNAGYYRTDAQQVTILSSKVREDDPTVLDVVYKVTSSYPTVKVRALAFKDGERTFAKVVRPETFIDGTDANIGDEITANEEHTLSWKVASDWQETLAKVSFEVLAVEENLLPMELTLLPKTAEQPEMEVSWNVQHDTSVVDALFWLYADKDLGLTLQEGVLKSGDTPLVSGASIARTRYEATCYVYNKMGYALLDGEVLQYARERLRRNFPGCSEAQYAVKILEDDTSDATEE